MADTVFVNSTRRSTAARRAGVVTAGVGSCLAAYGLLTLLLGDLQQPSYDGGAPHQLTTAAVAATSMVAGLLAWSSLAVLEHLGRRGPRLWVWIAVAALLASLGGPLSGTGVGPADRLALALLHLVLAIVVVPLLHRTTTTRVPPEEE